jgi:hypothetical protein
MNPLLQNTSERGADIARGESATVDSFHLHIVHGELVQPNLDLDRTSNLLAIDDETEFGADKTA